MKTVAIIQARMRSTRLPGKVMEDLGGMPVLEWVVRAAKSTRLINELWIATPDEEIFRWARAHGVGGFLGAEGNVHSRFTAIAAQTRPDLIVRLTADCPFLDPCLIDAAVTLEQCTDEFWPDGMDVQVFRPQTLKAYGDREHVISPRVRLPQCEPPLPDLRRVRLTLDTPLDLARLRAILPFLPKDRPPAWRETLDALRQLKAAA